MNDTLNKVRKESQILQIKFRDTESLQMVVLTARKTKICHFVIFKIIEPA